MPSYPYSDVPGTGIYNAGTFQEPAFMNSANKDAQARPNSQELQSNAKRRKPVPGMRTRQARKANARMRKG